MKIAVNIETKIWRNIILSLIQDDWQVLEKYMAHDASIDFDFLILKKENKKIFFGWDIIEEGEIKCENCIFDDLEKRFEIKFEYGIPKNLDWKTVLLIRISTLPQRLFSNPSKEFNDFF